MQHATSQQGERFYSEAEVAAIREATYRDAWQDGVEAMQLERAGKSFPLEDEAWQRWSQQHPLS